MVRIGSDQAANSFSNLVRTCETCLFSHHILLGFGTAKIPWPRGVIKLRLKFIPLIYVKMPTIVLAGQITGFGNLNLKFQPVLVISVIMSSLNFIFITSGSGFSLYFRRTIAFGLF